MTTPPGWYPDQANPQQLRWWGGTAWTHHVQPIPPQAPPQQAQPQRPAPAGADGALFAEPVLHVRKGVSASGGPFGSFDYDLVDGRGTQLGIVKQLELDEAAARARIFSGAAEKGLGLTQHFELYDMRGTLVLHIARAIRMRTAARPPMEVSLPDGRPVGIAQSEKLAGRTIRWGFTVHGQRVGGFTSKSMGGPFTVTDQYERQLAEFVRAGDRLNSDGYTLTRPGPIAEPLRTMVLAAPLTFDIAVFGHHRSGF